MPLPDRGPAPTGIENTGYAPRRRDLPIGSDVPIYKDVVVTPDEVAAAKDYLTRAPKARVIGQALGNTAYIHIAVHDTLFSTGRPTGALGGTREDPGGPKLASDLASDMEGKYLTLHKMLEIAGAPVNVREAARHDGGKSVIWADDTEALHDPDRRTDIMRNYGRFVRSLDGLYVPGADIGTNAADMSHVAEGAGSGRLVSCKTGDLPNSLVTAEGVHHAFRAAVDHRRLRGQKPQLWNTDTMVVAYSGLGNVGQPLLADMFSAYPGMQFVILEPSDEKIEQTNELLRRNGASAEEIANRITFMEDAADPKQLYRAVRGVDVFMPNSVAYQVNIDTVANMPEGSIYVGAGNDILPKVGFEDDPDVLALALEKDITGVTAYEANVGGITAIAVNDVGGTLEDAKRYVSGVYRMVRDTLAMAHRRHTNPELVSADDTRRHFAQFVKANGISL